MRTALLALVLSPILVTGQDEEESSALPPPVIVDSADHPSLQEAIDALPESGGFLRLAPGTIDITEPLVVTTPETRIQGSGPSSHIRNRNAEGKPALVLRPATRAEDPKARLWRVELANFRISGNEASGNGIHAEAIQEIFLQGVSVDHHGGHGIALIDCFENPRVSGCMITYNADAGLFIDGGHDIVVNANHFEENGDGVRCIDAFNLCMNGNNLDDHLGNGVVIENTYGSVLSGNMIEECQGTAIILDRDCYGIAISANVIAHEVKGGVDLRDAHGCSVSANTFTIVHEFGVRVGPDSGRITITGNSFSNSYMGEGAHKRKLESDNILQIDTSTGVVLEDTEHNTITGNTFSGLDGSAVTACDACRGILISGNTVTDFGRRAEEKPEAFAVPETESIRIGHNLVD